MAKLELVRPGAFFRGTQCSRHNTAWLTLTAATNHEGLLSFIDLHTANRNCCGINLSTLLRSSFWWCNKSVWSWNL